MTIVFMLSRMVIRNLSTQGIVISDIFLDEFRTPAPSLGFFVALASTRKCIFRNNLMDTWYEYTGVFVEFVGDDCKYFIFKAIRANTFRLRKMAIAVLTIAIPVCISLLIYANYQPK